MFGSCFWEKETDGDEGTRQDDDRGTQGEKGRGETNRTKARRAKARRAKTRRAKARRAKTRRAKARTRRASSMCCVRGPEMCRQFPKGLQFRTRTAAHRSGRTGARTTTWMAGIHDHMHTNIHTKAHMAGIHDHMHADTHEHKTHQHTLPREPG